MTCNEGRYNLNGWVIDGCEYECEPRLGGAEACRLDDDCDGNLDEGVTPPAELVVMDWVYVVESYPSAKELRALHARCQQRFIK